MERIPPRSSHFTVVLDNGLYRLTRAEYYELHRLEKAFIAEMHIGKKRELRDKFNGLVTHLKSKQKSAYRVTNTFKTI